MPEIAKPVFKQLGSKRRQKLVHIGKSDLAGMEGSALEGRIGRILSDRNVSESDDTAAALAALYEAGYKTAIPSDTPRMAFAPRRDLVLVPSSSIMR